MAKVSELLPELARSERGVADGQARIARQAELVRKLGADGHDTTFGAKRLLVMIANLNQLERRRQQLIREWSGSDPEPRGGSCRPFHLWQINAARCSVPNKVAANMGIKGTNSASLSTGV
jgi:hypothetical protein